MRLNDLLEESWGEVHLFSHFLVIDGPSLEQLGHLPECPGSLDSELEIFWLFELPSTGAQPFVQILILARGDNIQLVRPSN